MMPIVNDTANQTSIELQETSRGEQKSSDKIVCSTDDAKKITEIDNRSLAGKIFIEQTTLAEDKKEPTPASDVVINANTVTKKTWRKSKWLIKPSR